MSSRGAVEAESGGFSSEDELEELEELEGL